MRNPEQQNAPDQQHQAPQGEQSKEISAIRKFFRKPLVQVILMGAPWVIVPAQYYYYKIKLDNQLQEGLEAHWPERANELLQGIDDTIAAMNERVERNEYLETGPNPERLFATAGPVDKSAFLGFPSCLEYPKISAVTSARVLPGKQESKKELSISVKEKTIVFITKDAYLQYVGCIVSGTLEKTPHLIIRYSQNEKGKITDVRLMKAQGILSTSEGGSTVVPLTAPDDMEITDVDEQTKKKIMQKIEELLGTMDIMEQWEERAEEVKRNYPANQATALSKDQKLQKKIENGTVRVMTMHSGWTDSMSGCTGWIIAKDAIGTARHCVEDAETTRLLVSVDKVVTNGTQRAWFYTMYQPYSTNDYTIVMDDEERDDLAVIVTRIPRFQEKNALPVRSDILVPGTYVTGHLAGYTVPQFWKIDAGQISYSDIPDIAPLKFNFPNQGGNSGGAIVDANGDVVSLHSRTCIDRDSRVFSCGPHITPAKIETLLSRGREELKPPVRKSPKNVR